jgi:hypothetical protein
LGERADLVREDVPDVVIRDACSWGRRWHRGGACSTRLGLSYVTISISMERGRNMSRDAIRNVLKSRVSVQVWCEYESRRTCRNITSGLTTEELPVVASTSSSYILTLGPNPISFDALVEHHVHATTRLLFVHFGLPWRR